MSLFKLELLIKERICAQRETILSYKSRSLWYGKSILPNKSSSLECYYSFYYARAYSAKWELRQWTMNQQQQNHVLRSNQLPYIGHWSLLKLVISCSSCVLSACNWAIGSLSSHSPNWFQSPLALQQTWELHTTWRYSAEIIKSESQAARCTKFFIPTVRLLVLH